MSCMQWQGSDMDTYRFRGVAECPIKLTDADNKAAYWYATTLLNMQALRGA